MLQSGPVWLRVLFLPFRVFPSDPGFNFFGPVRSGFEKNPVRVFAAALGFIFFWSGLVWVSISFFVFVNVLFRWN